jgi:copper(I)-binding protein
MNRPCLAAALSLSTLAAGACAAPPAPEACAPRLESAWVRAAPPGAAMLAGYATVRNDCAQPVRIVGAESLDFASASLHATVDEGGVSRMRAAGALDVPARGRLVLAPGGTHLMLMGPAKALPEGARARIRLVLADGRRVFAEFEVRREAPPAR